MTHFLSENTQHHFELLSVLQTLKFGSFTGCQFF